MSSQLELFPLGGETGKAYRGIKDGQQFFLKRHTTPFLAAVSVDGIAPKLLWTQQTVHGEELTAQEWIDARNLTRVEMVQPDVLSVLQYIHRSHHLKNMFMKMMRGYQSPPSTLLELYREDLQKELETNVFLTDVYAYLSQRVDEVMYTEPVVCHGDIYHRNFLLSKEKRLYVVDWETVKLADPMLDIAALLCQYVHHKDWLKWLMHYGLTISLPVLKRLEWYGIYHCLMAIKKHHFLGNYQLMNENVLMIKQLFGKYKLY